MKRIRITPAPSALVAGAFAFVLFLPSLIAESPSPMNRIDLNQAAPVLERGHLDLGGENPSGERIDVNSFFIEKGGRPFIPVVGEFHYSRYPAERWEESLRKMKAGGINTVASYAFWNIHERREGHFDFSGDLDLRRFLELCEKLDLWTIVRIGPFAHGEMRNGGLPDWLYGRPFEVRSNDAGYLALVDRWYAALGGEMEGLYYKDGGRVIGIQLENEYQHSAAPWETGYPGAPLEYTVADLNRSVTYSQIAETDGVNPEVEYGHRHMRILRETAERHGMITPLYTATGWGNAAIIPEASLPVTGGYAYPFWAKPRPSPFYLYRNLHRTPDYSPVSYEAERYPSIAAEIGPGVAIRYDRRPYFEEASLAPLMTRLLGGGSNGIGYYVYHGGSTPVFEHFYSEEASGHLKINYDFQAPIGEYGQLRSHFHSVKLLHLFLESFGEALAPLGVIIAPSNEDLEPEDRDRLRFAARASEGSGFLFLHNFQDHMPAVDLFDQRIELEAGDETFMIPSAGGFDWPSGSWAVLPVNLDLAGVPLRSATVQPLTILRPENEKPHYVFVSRDGLRPEFVFAEAPEISGESVVLEELENAWRVSAPTGQLFRFSLPSAEVLVIPYERALEVFRVSESRLIFSDALVLVEDGRLELQLDGGEASLAIYPAIEGIPEVKGGVIERSEDADKLLSSFRVALPEVELPFQVERLSAGKIRISADPQGWDDFHDVFLDLEYLGDRAMAFVDGKLVADHFWHAKPWTLGLRRFEESLRAGKELLFLFHPLTREAAFLEDFDPRHAPSFGPDEDSVLRVERVAFRPQQKIFVSLPR